MFVQPIATRPKRAPEAVFDLVFLLNLVINVLGFVVAFADFYDRTKNTFVDYFGNSVTFNYSTPLNIIFRNCSYAAPVTIGGVTDRAAMVDSVTASPGFLFIANVIIAVFVVHGLLILTLAISFLLYSESIRHFRVGGSFLPIMSWVPTVNVLLSIADIALIWGTKDLREFYDGFVASCASEFVALNAKTFLDAEYDTNVIFATNLNWIFAPIIVNLAVLALAAMHHLAEGLRPGYVALAKAQYPWERGPFCLPDKKRLAEWTRRRAYLLESLERMDVTAVIPWPQFQSGPEGTWIGGPEFFATLPSLTPSSSVKAMIPVSSNASLRRGGHGGGGGLYDVGNVQYAPGGGYGGDLGMGSTWNVPPPTAHRHYNKHHAPPSGDPFPTYFNANGVGEGEGEAYLPEDDTAPWNSNNLIDGEEEVVGTPEEVTEAPSRRKHRHRRHGDEQGAEMPVGEDGGEEGEQRRHRHRRRHRRTASQEKAAAIDMGSVGVGPA